MAFHHPQRIVVGVDFSPLCQQALRESLGLTSEAGAELHVTHVARYPTSVDELNTDLKSLIEDVLEHWVAHRPTVEVPRIHAHVRVGAPAAELIRLASDVRADLIVAGTSSHRGLDRLILGSVAEQVVRTAPCRVLIVRHRVAGANHCVTCLLERQRSKGSVWWCSEHERDQKEGGARSTKLVHGRAPADDDVYIEPVDAPEV